MSGRYLAVGHDAKTVKGVKVGYLTGILYLAPGNMSGREFCPNRTPGCSRDCLFTAGRGVMPPVYAGRMRKSQEFSSNPGAFVDNLAHEINALVRKAAREGLTPVVRLNGTSDLPWENIHGAPAATSSMHGALECRSLMAYFPHVQFYDYTKSYARMRRYLSYMLPHNYHLTFSRSELNEDQAKAVLLDGGNVAVVFSTRKGDSLPASWHGVPVIDGDVNDVRHLDPSGIGVVVGLRAKGKARRSASGFVVNVHSSSQFGY